MQVIPVADIRGGAAVAAVRGDRARYRPIETPLAASADPVDVALGLRTLFPFASLYVADLDGIEGRGPDIATQRRLGDAWPGAELWIDDGAAGAHNDGLGLPPTLALPTGGREPVASHPSDAIPPPLWGRLGGGESQCAQSSIAHVIGSESMSSLEAYERARDTAGASAILSLDFRGDAFVGPRELLTTPALWPKRLIAMTLARVGSGEGPDLERLRSIIVRANGRDVYAAGGVRNLADLVALRAIGAAGALVATALHTGKITAADLAAIAQST
jgi:phosphoribosylformimino-5-aminoimidazole carboxamide ribotide isomerase